MTRIVISAVLLAVVSCVNISNVAPRRTVGGSILPAHDGGIYQYGHGLKSWYFYGMSYGMCQESDGCSNSTTGACGFRDDHNVSIFTSPDLSQDS